MFRIEWVDRKRFIETRYRAFKVKQLHIQSLPKNMQDMIYLTDLDSIDTEAGVPIKDLVLCDRCNENITEDYFVMFEKSKVWHEKCAEKYLPDHPKPNHNITMLFKDK